LNNNNFVRLCSARIFIIDTYQIYEARVYGADTVLIIVAAFKQSPHESTAHSTDSPTTPSYDVDNIKQLMECSRSIGMEPLVEVNSLEELRIAVTIGAKVIGINNRNLHTFQVDIRTTGNILAEYQSIYGSSLSHSQQNRDVIIVALSGINVRADVCYLETVGVDAILVGESLMKSADPALKIRQLRGEEEENVTGVCKKTMHKPYVKICGIKDPETAIATAEAGADFLGLVFAQKSTRLLTVDDAKLIVASLHEWSKRRKSNDDHQNLKLSTSGLFPPKNEDDKELGRWFCDGANAIEATLKSLGRPLIVGVFADDDASYVNRLVTEVGLDIVQLSGLENASTAALIEAPTWKAIHVPAIVHSDTERQSVIQDIHPFVGLAMAILLDTKDASARGGTGRSFDWSIAKSLSDNVLPIILAGGLNPENISEAVATVQPFIVDVSSGVESGGKKDLNKIRNFIKLAKSSS